MATPTKAKNKTRQIVAKRDRGWWRVQFVTTRADGVAEMYSSEGHDLDRAIHEIREQVAAHRKIYEQITAHLGKGSK
jgi:hypothetical protein